VWTYAGANTFGKERDAELAMHPTVKPVGLVADAIMDCSRRGGIVLDAFAGSGSTLIAAEKTGRKGYGIELDPYYVDTIVRRFEATYSLKAVHAQTGREFGAIEKERLAKGRGHASKKDSKAKRANGPSGSRKAGGRKGRAR
jgi:DNA modification methylase